MLVTTDRAEAPPAWTEARFLDARSGVLRILEGESTVVSLAPTDLPTANGRHHRRSPYSSPRFVGSDAATTCLVVAMRTADTVLFAHLNSASASAELLQRAAALAVEACPTTPACDVWMLGSFRDVRGTSEEIVSRVVAEMHDSALVTFVLKAVCVLDENTNVDTGAPRFTGLAFDLVRGEAFPAKFDAIYPGKLRRCALGWLDQTLVPEVTHRDKIWDLRGHGTLHLRSFRCKLSDQFCMFMRQALTLGDKEFLALTSTSPDFESVTYCDDVRETFQWLLRNRNLLVPDEQYVWNDGSCLWDKISEQPEIDKYVASMEDDVDVAKVGKVTGSGN
jgi:Protein N-terminal asparagine amidohydrolase